MVAPYNSNANNPWTSTDSSGNIVFRDYAAMPDCIWMFPGTGTDFPLEPGEEAVVAYYGVGSRADLLPVGESQPERLLRALRHGALSRQPAAPHAYSGRSDRRVALYESAEKNRNEYGRGLCDIAEFACRDPFPGARRFRSGRLSGQRSRIGDRQRQRRLFENSVGVDRTTASRFATCRRRPETSVCIPMWTPDTSDSRPRRRDTASTAGWTKRPLRAPDSTDMWIPIIRRTIFTSVRHNLCVDSL